MKRISLFVFILILGVCAFYIPHQNLFFSTDDWFHLRLAQINSPQEFANFFSFQKNDQTASFYRPLPTQVFFFAMQTLFGLQALPYYWAVLGFFALLLLLIFILGRKLGLTYFQSGIATLLYGIASSNIPRLHFLSAFQEVSMTIFVVAAILIFLELQKTLNTFRRNLVLVALCLVSFILALASKETAIVLPFILLGFLAREVLLKSNFLRKDLLSTVSQLKTEALLIFCSLLVAAIYLYARLSIFGSADGDTYVWDTSLKSSIHTFTWYSIWALGAPEMLIDYVGSGFKVLPSFYSDYGSWSLTIVAGLFASITGLLFFVGMNVLRLIRKSFKSKKSFSTLLLIGFFAGDFVLSLVPVLFLPLHKFSHALGLPLVWFALGIAFLLPKTIQIKNGALILLLLIPYLGYNIAMHEVYQKWHYSQNRALISKQVFDFFSETYPTPPPNKQFIFVNDFDPGGGASWGTSKQISHSTMQSEMWRVLYKDHTYLVLFQDLPHQDTLGGNQKLHFFNRIPVSSRQFLTE